MAFFYQRLLNQSVRYFFNVKLFKLDQSAKEFINTKTDKNDVDYYRYLKDLEICAN